HFEHVVAAAGVPQKSVRILNVLVAGAYPSSEDGVSGPIVLVPVAGADGVALDQQVANIANRHGLTVVVQDPGLVAGHWFARRTGTDGARLVGDEDVQDLGGTDAVEDLDPVAFFKAFEDGRWQGFTGRNAPPHGTEIAFGVVGQDLR